MCSRPDQNVNESTFVKCVAMMMEKKVPCIHADNKTIAVDPEREVVDTETVTISTIGDEASDDVRGVRSRHIKGSSPGIAINVMRNINGRYQKTYYRPKATIKS